MGNVGKHAIAAVHEHPDLELVGAFVYTDAKTGRDAGEIAGIGPIGVTATTDRDQILALDADCVLYMAEGEWNPPAALADVCALLASGKNVVSTAVTAWIYPTSTDGDIAAKLAAACEQGRTSFHATGIQPGWAAEVLPLTTSPLFRRIDSLLVQEIMDYTTYDVPFVLFDVMGFGKPPGQAVPMDEPAIGALSFEAPLMLLAEGLGATIDGYMAAMARFGGPAVTANLIDGHTPAEWRRGPVLAEAAYPDVQVARAVTDGRRLDLVLYPGTRDPVDTVLGFQRLDPGTTYQVTGRLADHIVPATDGSARLPIRLTHRTEIRIRPTMKTKRTVRTRARIRRRQGHRLAESAPGYAITQAIAVGDGSALFPCRVRPGRRTQQPGCLNGSGCSRAARWVAADTASGECRSS